MISTRDRWLLCSLVLAALVIAVVTGPPAQAAVCAPVNESRVRDAARAYLKVPAEMSFELVASHPVGTNCYTRRAHGSATRPIATADRARRMANRTLTEEELREHLPAWQRMMDSRHP